jgi:rhodanese-related sulfurtransferase
MMILVFAFIGCSDDDGGTTPPPAADGFSLVSPYTDAYLSTYVTPNRGLGINISAQVLYNANFGNTDPADDYFVVDWRSPAVYDNAHIAGAVNWSLSEIIDHVNAGDFPTDKPICNVCYTGQTASTATAIMNLLGIDMGFDAVNLAFGMSGWTSDTSYSGTDYTTKLSSDYGAWMTPDPCACNSAGSYPALGTGLGTGLDILKARADAYVKGAYNDFGTGWNSRGISNVYDSIAADDGTWYVVNYFPTTEYDAGHMPTAVQYAPKSSLQTDNTLNTLPVDQKILTYCWTGQTSAQVTVCLNMLGYQAYSMVFGVQSLCYDNTSVNTHPFNPAQTDYPCVGTAISTK